MSANNYVEVVREKAQDGITGEAVDLALTLQKIISTGSFAPVFQAKILPSLEDAAVKRVLQDKRFKNRELEIMRIVRHPNIVDLKAFYYSNGERKGDVYLNFVLEYVPETIYRASRYFNKQKTTMPGIEVKLYTYEIFRALAYIHSQNICHRDVKPQNVLLNPATGVIKLCDFGSSKYLVKDEPNISYICSRYYRAPELIFDIWSTGCIMAELLLGQPLFPGESGIDQLVEIIKVLGTPTRHEIQAMNPNYMEHKFPQIKPHPFDKVFRKAEPGAIKLAAELLVYVPLQRPCASEAMVHSFFDELRLPETRLPDSRTPGAAPRQLPPLFDFSLQELSIRPDLVQQLVPPHAEASLRSKGIDIYSSNFVLDKGSAHSTPPQGKQNEQNDQPMVEQEDVDVESINSESRLRDHIRAMVQSQPKPPDGIYHIRCQVSCEILRYCHEQLDGQFERLRQVIALTGTLATAQAASCEDFVRQVWPLQGLKILDAVIHFLEKNEACDIMLAPTHRLQLRLEDWISDLSIDDAHDNFEKVEISISGSLDDVVATMEQLSWVAAVFRSPVPDSLTISSATFDWWDLAERDYPRPEQTESAFKLCLNPLKVEKLDSSLRLSGTSTCWWNLFQGVVLTSGFTVTQRDEGAGLDIPFELMAFLAQVRTSMDYDGGTILIGDSSCLFPSKRLQAGVQWHLTNAEDSDSLNDSLMSHPEWLREKDLGVLTSLRTFLGYYPSARVLLGTEKLLQEHPVAKSGFPNAPSRIELARDGTTTAGFAVKGIFNGTIGGRWAVPNGLRVDLTEHRACDDRLEKASIRPIILYDHLTCSAWLVPELSLVLHMVLTYLKQPRVQERRRLRRRSTPEVWPKMPFVDACIDAGAVAHKAISDNHNLYLYTDEYGKNILFWNMIDDTLKDLASIRSATNLRKASSGWQIFASRLQGWDFNDLAVKEESVHQRESYGDSKRASWWRLSDDKGMLVVFGRNYGQLIEPDLTQSKVYSGWESVPTGAELLTASKPCLLQLAADFGSKDNQTEYLLSPETAWHKPTSKDKSCNQYCNSSCLCIQELRTVKTAKNLVRRSLSNVPINPPGKLTSSCQAVVFGDAKYYHQSLQLKFWPTTLESTAIVAPCMDDVCNSFDVEKVSDR